MKLNPRKRPTRGSMKCGPHFRSIHGIDSKPKPHIHVRTEKVGQFCHSMRRWAWRCVLEMNIWWIYGKERVHPGGGGGTASLKVTTHCQTTAPVFQGSPSLFFFYRPLFLGVVDHRPLKSNFLNAKLCTKVNPILPQGISCNEYHVFYKID